MLSSEINNDSQAMRQSRKANGSKDFVPLKDLLTKNLDDRIQDYLNRMEGMTVDEIVKSGTLAQTPRK